MKRAIRIARSKAAQRKRSVRAHTLVDFNLVVSEKWFSAYNSAFRAGAELELNQMPLVGQIERVSTEHAGPRLHIGEHGTFTAPMRREAFGARMCDDAIIAFDLTAHANFINDIMDQAGDSQMRMLRNGFEASTRIAGTAVDANGGALTVERIRDLVRATEWDFDSSGVPKPKTLAFSAPVSPTVRDAVMNAFEDAKRDPEIVRILLEKRRAVEARRASRRLV